MGSRNRKNRVLSYVSLSTIFHCLAIVALAIAPQIDALEMGNDSGKAGVVEITIAEGGGGKGHQTPEPPKVEPYKVAKNDSIKVPEPPAVKSKSDADTTVTIKPAPKKTAPKKKKVVKNAKPKKKVAKKKPKVATKLPEKKVVKKTPPPKPIVEKSVDVIEEEATEEDVKMKKVALEEDFTPLPEEDPNLEEYPEERTEAYAEEPQESDEEKMAREIFLAEEAVRQEAEAKHEAEIAAIREEAARKEAERAAVRKTEAERTAELIAAKEAAEKEVAAARAAEHAASEKERKRAKAAAAAAAIANARGRTGSGYGKSKHVGPGNGGPNKVGKGLGGQGIYQDGRDLVQIPGNPKPIYPRKSRFNKESGLVTLKYYVNDGGYVSNVQVMRSSGHQRLDKAAVNAARKWRFKPGQSGPTIHPVNFSLKGPAETAPARLRTSG